MTGTTAPLSLAESTPLAHALAHAVADRNLIRLISIKGPVSSHHGLRSQRTSSDADVLVEPDRFSDFLVAMAGAGWNPRFETDAPQPMAPHSATLANATWIGDVDAHWYYPGFLADELDVFNALWESRVQIEIAHSKVNATSSTGSAIISVLHALRSGREGDQELETLLVQLRALDNFARTELVDLAERTGAIEPLRASLERSGIDIAFGPPLASEKLIAWELRNASVRGRTTGWVVDILNAPLRKRPRMLLQAVWVPRPDYQRQNANTDVALGNDLTLVPRYLWRKRITRLWRGLRDLPRAMSAVHAARSKLGGRLPTAGRKKRF